MVPLASAIPRLWCHTDPAASSTTVPRRPRVAPAVLPRRPRCHAVHAAMPTLRSCRPQCLPAACHTSRVATLALLPRSPHCHADPAALLTAVPRRPLVAPAVLPRRPRCHAVRAAKPTLLPCRQQCLAGLEHEHTQERNLSYVHNVQ